jgi:tetratricopeptide (TPR) repeat protein
MGAKAGWKYAQRISPVRTQVYLSFFGKGSKAIKQGKALAKRGDWDGAQAIWREDLENPDLKVRGRAAHNIAVANEVRGNLDTALEWATTASYEYGNKVAWEYYEELAGRVERRREAEAQLAAAVSAESREPEVGELDSGS